LREDLLTRGSKKRKEKESILGRKKEGVIFWFNEEASKLTHRITIKKGLMRQKKSSGKGGHQEGGAKNTKITIHLKTGGRKG